MPLRSSSSTGSGSVRTATSLATPRISSFANLSVLRRSGRSDCSFNDLAHVAATPATPATPVFGVILPRIAFWSLAARSPFIAAPIEDARREDVDAVCAIDLSHRLQAIARPQQHAAFG